MIQWVKSCAFELNDIPIVENLNMFPFETYNMLLGIDWLYIDQKKIDFYDKGIECLDKAKVRKILQGNRNTTLVSMIMAMQAKWNHRKGCLLFVMHILSNVEASKSLGKEDSEVLNIYHSLQK